MTKIFSAVMGVAVGTLTYAALEHERKQTPEYKREEKKKEIKNLEEVRRFFYKEKARGRHVKRSLKVVNSCIKDARDELRAI